MSRSTSNTRRPGMGHNRPDGRPSLPPLYPGGRPRPLQYGAPVNSSYMDWVIPPNFVTGWNHNDIVSAEQVKGMFSDYNKGRKYPMRPMLNHDQYVVKVSSHLVAPGQTGQNYYYITPTEGAVQRSQETLRQTKIARTPRGFRNYQQFEQSMKELIEAARKDGLVDLYQPLSPGYLLSGSTGTAWNPVQIYKGFVGIRGSSITGRSAAKATTFNERPDNGRKASDIDVFIVIPPRNINGRSTGIVFSSKGYPNIMNWSRNWSKQLKPHPISVMIRKVGINNTANIENEPYVFIMNNGTMGPIITPPGF